jgi:hypothetical protein
MMLFYENHSIFSKERAVRVDKAAEKRDYFDASGELAEMLFSVMLRGGLRLDPWNLIRVMPAKER